MIRAALLLAALVIACGPDEAPTETVDVGTDARAIAEILDSDPCGVAIDDALHAMDTERPVMAASFLTEDALPGARQQLTRIEAIHALTSEGRTLRSRALRIHRARITALEHLRDALARGPVEDDTLLDAIHESATAEHDLQLLRADLAPHAPLPERPEVPGATAIHSTDRVDRGDTTDEPAEGEERAGELDDALPEM